MRCYLMRKGHIVDAEYLRPGSDGSLIKQSEAHFVRRSAEAFDGFEVWDGTRRVHVYAKKTDQPSAKCHNAPRRSGGKCQPAIEVSGSSTGTKGDIHCNFELRGCLFDLSIWSAEIGDRQDGRQEKARQLIVELCETLISRLDKMKEAPHLGHRAEPLQRLAKRPAITSEPRRSADR